MDSPVRMTNIELHRDRKPILQNLSWTVETGQHWALIGLNGSGKTSLLKMISGYLWPSRGHVEILGRRLGRCDVRELRKTIGTVSHAVQEQLHYRDPAVEVVITGKEAALTLYRERKKEDEQEALAWLERMGTSHLAEQPYGLLSQGEKQKVLVARALMAHPQLFVLDEPCAGLDIRAREELLSRLETIVRDHQTPTLIYVTHHIEEILPEVTHVMLLKEGRVIAQGQKEAILTDAYLKQALDLPVHVEWKYGRPWLQVLKESDESSFEFFRNNRC